MFDEEELPVGLDHTAISARAATTSLIEQRL